MSNLFSIDLPTLPSAQFRAIVLCGYGSNLYPLIETHSSLTSDEEGGGPGVQEGKKEYGQIKALLPVAGKRMMDWVLERIEEAGVYDILVLSPKSIAGPVGHHLRARRSGNWTAKVELEELPDAIARRGTVQVLRWAAETGLIESDFLVMPCDLLLSPAVSTNPTISLASVLDKHRVDDNLMTTLFAERAAGGVVEAAKDGPSEILTIYDRKTSTLLDLREMEEYVDDDEIPLRTSLLSAFPSPTLSCNLLPTHLYIFSSAILPLLSSPAHDKRLRHTENFLELAAWISRLGWRNGGKNAVGYRDRKRLRREDGEALGRSSMLLAVGDAQHHGSFSDSRDPRKGSTFSLSGTGYNTPAPSSTAHRPTLSSHPTGPVWGSEENEKKTKKVGGGGGCKIVVWRKEDGWCGRGNTVDGWVEMCRAAQKLVPPMPSYPVGVSADSFLHPTVLTNLGDRVGIKRSIIGKGCIIARGSKLNNVVMMEGVVIGENTKLDNCVISNGVQIREKAVLKDCEIGRNVIIEAEASLKNEQLVVELD